MKIVTVKEKKKKYQQNQNSGNSLFHIGAMV